MTNLYKIKKRGRIYLQGGLTALKNESVLVKRITEPRPNGSTIQEAN